MKRIRDLSLISKIVSASQAASFVKSGMTVAISGFTPTGYPKEIPKALSQRKDENLKITLYSGASVGFEVDSLLTKAGMIEKRAPYQTNADMKCAINSGEVEYFDMHLSHFPQYLEAGFLGDIDLAIIEGTMFDEEGIFYPALSVGVLPQIIEKAKKVLVEINEHIPVEVVGMHDIYSVGLPPYRKPIPIEKASERIGTTGIRIEPDKIAGIVLTNAVDDNRPFSPPDESTRLISDHIIDFLKNEVEKGALPENLLPIQSGVGVMANAVLSGLGTSGFRNLSAYTEVIQDSMLELIDSGVISHASGTSLTLSKERFESFSKQVEKYYSKITLRPQEITNSPEVIRRLGVISINTALEIDIYGHVNSTIINGGCMVNGIGGSGDFARNAYISIFTAKSTYSLKNLSSIVFKASHVDHTEHDVDAVVTEYGLADLRGLSPKQRAMLIIERCAHPDHRGMLKNYFTKSLEVGNCKHQPLATY